MEKEVDILGAKLNIRDIVREDGTFTTFGLLLLIGLSLSLFRYIIMHPNQIREIVCSEVLFNEKH